eukprot:COSAG01_NODE_61419_length_289_cov_1.747368_1_plen_57_part_10
MPCQHLAAAAAAAGHLLRGANIGVICIGRDTAGPVHGRPAAARPVDRAGWLAAAALR